MKYIPIPKRRILALHPTPKGLGYVLIESDPRMLVDWGVHSPGSGGPSGSRLISRLIVNGKPSVLLMEDWRYASTLRRGPLRNFIDQIVTAIDSADLPIRLHSRHSVRSSFASAGVHTRRDIALALAEEFPELVAFLPPKRVIWESMDRREPIFDALALAVYEMGLAE